MQTATFATHAVDREKHCEACACTLVAYYTGLPYRTLPWYRVCRDCRVVRNDGLLSSVQAVLEEDVHPEEAAPGIMHMRVHVSVRAGASLRVAAQQYVVATDFLASFPHIHALRTAYLHSHCTASPRVRYTHALHLTRSGCRTLVVRLVAGTR